MGIGPFQPPRNRIDANKLTAIIEPYSAMKKKLHRRPEYSVWKPATSSLSASARSKGARFTLAVAHVKYTQNVMNVNGSWKMYQFQKPPACRSPMKTRSIDPASSTGTTAHMPERHFVADDLGRFAHRTEQRPLGCRRVAGQDHAEHFQAEHGDDEEHGHVEVDGDERISTAGEGNRHEHGE